MEKTDLQPPSPQTEPGHASSAGPRADSPSADHADKLSSKYISTERRFPENTVFRIDESPFISSMPNPTHWSVAWSDLMMTMFILFVAMFVYQAANREFLAGDELEVVGGDTTEALEIGEESRTTLPFAPIKPGLPLITAGTVKKVMPTQLQDAEDKTEFPSDKSKQAQERIKKAAEADLAEIEARRAKEILEDTSKQAWKSSEKTVEAGPAKKETAKQTAVIPAAPPLEAIPATTPAPKEDQLQEMYTLSQDALENANLEKFAAIDLIPDKTVRIVLTGDLFFETGRAELPDSAKESLKKITGVIKKTPYMINIVGHTDNIPMRSGRFSTNWELSVARASRVARFLIEEMGMDPNQFVVSGYASYRPLKPNTDTRNRAANRRVEIIISKKLPPPAAATPENIH